MIELNKFFKENLDILMLCNNLKKLNYFIIKQIFMRILTFTFLLISNIVIAQTNSIPKHRIGVQVTPFSTFEVFTFQNLVGTGEYLENSSQNFAIMYEKALDFSFAFETGINYGVHKGYFSPAITNGTKPPLIKQKLEMISIPALAKYYWGNYFFVNGGLILDLELSSKNNIDNQTGIGAMAGLGAKYDFNKKYSLQLNPAVNVHSLIPFSSSKYHQRLLEPSIKLGFYYSLFK